MPDIAAQRLPLPPPQQQQSETSFIYFQSIVITGSAVLPSQLWHAQKPNMIRQNTNIHRMQHFLLI